MKTRPRTKSETLYCAATGVAWLWRCASRYCCSSDFYYYIHDIVLLRVITRKRSSSPTYAISEHPCRMLTVAPYVIENSFGSELYVFRVRRLTGTIRHQDHKLLRG